MVFSSITFVLYFLTIFMVLYYLMPSKYRNITLLAGSVFFIVGVLLDSYL